MPQSPDLNEQVRAATALLETLAAERERLLDVSEDDRNRLLSAAGEVSRPDAIRRRQMGKATERKRKAERRDHIHAGRVAVGQNRHPRTAPPDGHYHP